jgi:hypothetical protein
MNPILIRALSGSTRARIGTMDMRPGQPLIMGWLKEERCLLANNRPHRMISSLERQQTLSIFIMRNLKMGQNMIKVILVKINKKDL